MADVMRLCVGGERAIARMLDDSGLGRPRSCLVAALRWESSHRWPGPDVPRKGGSRVPASRFRSGPAARLHICTSATLHLVLYRTAPRLRPPAIPWSRSSLPLPEKPGSTRPGAAKLSTPASFTSGRTCCSCVPASPHLFEPRASRALRLGWSVQLQELPACWQFRSLSRRGAGHSESHGFVLPRLSPTLPSDCPHAAIREHRNCFILTGW